MDVDPSFLHLLDLSVMQMGGYPLEKNDLSKDAWMVLGIISEEREALRR